MDRVIPMAYKVAICDDSKTDAAYVEKMLYKWAKDRDVEVYPKAFPSAENFMWYYAEDKLWDILLLDIEMGDMDGVTMAKEVRRDNEAVQIVFITGYPNFAQEGYEVSALHYLMKPVNQDKLFATLDRAVSNLQKKERAILLPLDGETLRLPVKEIQYIESFSHNIAIATANATLQVKMPISEIEKLLGDGFIRCHRSYLAGLRYIARISRTEIIMDSGKILPISRSASSLVHRAFISYYKGVHDETV